MDILDRISELLNGREQRELTDYLGLKSVAFSEWKSGKSKSYRKYLIEIAEFFNVSIDYLVYGKEKNRTSINMSHSVGANLYGTVTIGTDSVNVKERSESNSETAYSYMNGLDGEVLKIFHRLPLKEQYRMLAVMCEFEEEYLKNRNE